MEQTEIYSNIYPSTKLFISYLLWGRQGLHIEQKVLLSSQEMMHIAMAKRGSQNQNYKNVGCFTRDLWEAAGAQRQVPVTELSKGLNSIRGVFRSSDAWLIPGKAKGVEQVEKE